MAKVFGGGSGSSCGDSGINRVLPTSQEALSSSQSQQFVSTPNVYSKTRSATGDANLQDFYTKSEVLRLLKTKADISSVYDKPGVDALLVNLEAEINSSLTQFLTESEIDSKISDSYNSLLGYLAQNYYFKSQIYTKAEVDSLLATIEIGNEFIRKEPSSTADNTIFPGSSNAVPLTLVASVDPDVTTIQHWIDNQSNSVARIRTSGRVEFYGDLVLGQNVESWKAALDVNEHRISGVASPIHPSDAVNKGYLEEFIYETVDNIVQGENGLYTIDALTY